MRTKRRTTIGAELRKRFKSPREALAALGIDERLLSEPGLAYDSLGYGAGSPSGQRESENVSIEVEQADDEDLVRRRDRAEDFLRERGLSEDDLEECRPMIEDAIRRARRDRANGRDQPSLPRSGLEGGVGGRLHELETRLAERGKARDRKMARDERRRERFEGRFAESARLAGTLVEAGLESAEERARRMRPPSEARIAADARAAKGFAERFPEAARIG